MYDTCVPKTGEEPKKNNGSNLAIDTMKTIYDAHMLVGKIEEQLYGRVLDEKKELPPATGLMNILDTMRGMSRMLCERLAQICNDL